MLNVDLSKLAGGELQEKFNREITKVIENMQDPNTSYSEARSVTIKLTLKQTEFRDDAKVAISVTSKLAGVISSSTNFAMGKNLENGEVAINEYGKQIPGQMSFEDVEQPQTDSSTVIKLPRQLKA